VETTRPWAVPVGHLPDLFGHPEIIALIEIQPRKIIVTVGDEPRRELHQLRFEGTKGRKPARLDDLRELQPAGIGGQ
jgi:hypothetical protein